MRYVYQSCLLTYSDPTDPGLTPQVGNYPAPGYMTVYWGNKISATFFNSAILAYPGNYGAAACVGCTYSDSPISLGPDTAKAVLVTGATPTSENVAAPYNVYYDVQVLSKHHNVLQLAVWPDTSQSDVISLAQAFLRENPKF